MKLTVIVHEAILQERGFANEGGYWAEVPAIPGCATEGDSWDELISNLHEAILLGERLRQRRLFVDRS
jgi:predicted RNase H-like HicB family nuclease